MNILGSERVITQTFSNHNSEAEDYAGNHLSDVKIFGTGKVISVINKFKPHENSINYTDFLNNKNSWKDGNYYNCISITGASVRFYHTELGGNEIWIESYLNNEKRYLRIDHLAEVLVSVGDIVNSNTVIAKQGNTGLVLSNKKKDDITYGSHIHVEVRDANYNYINPREYALGNIVVNYKEQSNSIDPTEKQIKIIADKINIREKYSASSKDLGDVYQNEIYTVLDEVEDSTYIWYQIITNLGTQGYVASLKGGRWIEVFNDEKPGEIVDEIIVEPVEEPTEETDEPRLIFTCEKDGLYAIRLNTGEKLYIL